jgi:type II secretory pathway component GspD/PulD (secretin)
MKVPSISTESGKQAVIKVGNLEYAVTPTLLEDGSVDLNAVLTQRDGDKADVLTVPTIKATIGQAAEINIGDTTFETTTSLAK